MPEADTPTSESRSAGPAGCLDDFDPGSIAPEQARARVLAAVQPIEDTETVALRSSLGRVLAQDIPCPADVPPAPNSAMDGYALQGADIPPSGTRELRVLGTALAGRPFAADVPPGAVVRIMTGAVLPRGTDTVIAQERVRRDGDRVQIGPDTRPGDNVRQAGEDLRAGDIVLARGRRLTPADLGLLASIGAGDVEVFRRPRIAYFSTGDELRSIGEALGPGEIHDSNRYTLHGMLARLNVDAIDLGVVRDRPDAVESAFREAADRADAIITSGGVSVGEADYVKETLQRVGVVDFWKVAMKPGRPLAFGRVRDAWFFGLPGNPVSVMVTFAQFVGPALRRLAGEAPDTPFTVLARCESKLKKRPGRVEYQRGILGRDASGALIVRKTGAQGSGILSSMSQANCFIVLPLESGGVEPGGTVVVEPFAGLI